METTPLSKGRKITAWILVGLISALLVMSAIMKLTVSLDSEMGKNLIKMGLGDSIRLIGVGELLAAILFLIPKTSSLGVLLVSAHLGGAIATHMEHGEMYLGPSVILVLIWVGNYLRNPEMLASFRK